MEQIPYELIEVEKADWNATVENFVTDLMFKSDYVELLSKSFLFDVRYLIIKEKGTINLASVIFIKKNKVVLADNYTYQPLWVNPTISERRQNGVLTYFIQYLKANFNSIKLKLSPLIKDIRPFKWEGFSVEPRFTYLRSINSPIHKKISGRIKKLRNEMPDILIGEPSMADISINIEFLKNLKFNNRKVGSYQCFLTGLKELGCLKTFTLKVENEIYCAYLVLVDLANKKAYTLMVNGADRNHRQLHALLYQEINNWADLNGVKTVDFCGANIKGISNFKSYFNPTLQLFYTVRFSYFHKVILYLTQIVNKF